jgi:hypothetical protein
MANKMCVYCDFLMECPRMLIKDPSMEEVEHSLFCVKYYMAHNSSGYQVALASEIFERMLRIFYLLYYYLRFSLSSVHFVPSSVFSPTAFQSHVPLHSILPLLYSHCGRRESRVCPPYSCVSSYNAGFSQSIIGTGYYLCCHVLEVTIDGG